MWSHNVQIQRGALCGGSIKNYLAIPWSVPQVKQQQQQPSCVMFGEILLHTVYRPPPRQQQHLILDDSLVHFEYKSSVSERTSEQRSEWPFNLDSWLFCALNIGCIHNTCLFSVRQNRQWLELFCNLLLSNLNRHKTPSFSSSLD